MASPAARVTGLIYQSGAPVPATAVDRARRSGLRAGLGGGYTGHAFAYDAAAIQSTEMGDWMPWIRSADGEINQHRDRMVARQRDLVRNDGWASGAIGRILDSTIGSSYRRIARPDWRLLSAFYGPKFDKVWAREYGQRSEAIWRRYSESHGRWNDVARQLTVAQQFRLALRHKLIDGESLMIRLWLPDRLGEQAAHYATSHQVIDPDLLSNPFQAPDSRYLRNGVELDDYGVPVAYHVRRAHQNDWYNSVESQQWERIVREDEDGFRRVLHDFDRDRAGQNRGLSIFAPIVSRLKMLARYYGVSLQAATVASVFGTYVTSPYDQQMIERALNDGDEDDAGEELSFYAGMREDFHQRNGLQLNNARVPLLAPGEDIKTVSSAAPHGEFTPFAHEMLRGLSACLGMSAEQVHNDYSETNFSSARAGINEAEKTYRRRVGDFNDNTATPVYAGVMHEAHDRGDFADVLPRGAPPFMAEPEAYCAGRWLGAARGWLDPVAERQGKLLGLAGGFDTLQDISAEQGQDYEELLDQRAEELRMCQERGLPPPEWLAGKIAASQVAQKPDQEQA